jgi:hypothetical protein
MRRTWCYWLLAAALCAFGICSVSAQGPATITQPSAADKVVVEASMLINLRAVRTNMAASINVVQTIATTNTTAAAQADQIKALKQELLATQRALQDVRHVLAGVIKGN